ncbi:MAG: cell division protein ZapA [Gemmatimonadota bacterium]
MSEEPKSIRVTIFGEDYAIRSEKGTEYTRLCARHVDDAIQQAHVHGHVSEPHKAAILGAMQITDELFTCREGAGEQTRMVIDRLSALRRSIDAALAKE